MTDQNTGRNAQGTGGSNGRMPSLMEQVEADRASGDRVRKARSARRVESIRSRLIGVGLALLGGAGGVALATIDLGPSAETGRVDAARGDLENVLGYALLSDDFNNLPIEERLAYLEEFARRFSNMSSGESAAMAAFAAGIEDELRARLERNVGELMVDVMDRFASQYAGASDEDAEAAIEEALLGMFELMQRMSEAADMPMMGNASPEEALERRKERTEARMEEAKDSDTGSIRTEQAARALRWAEGGMGSQGTTSERARISRFMRDASRYMQGRDVRTGEPKD